MNQEPIQVEIVQRVENHNDESGCLGIIGGLAWITGLTIYWVGSDLFDTTEGRIGFLIAAFIAGAIGYYTTAFLLAASFIFFVGGALISWIFDFPFFDTTLIYIAKAYQYLFN